ncbi:hypothetical protein [Polaribacter sp. SA4-12]|uniref:hypothetical protein n=1 Tax=Polaribacter sp. SA4-12 TaxID=1312072 RepID=UPI000B3C52F1|nr:hypothetical protein [Polaribacter sp. SA4-12]ARV15864.1 hypothetical protein BTO07_12250 [Polaribacter sp. SA4-12]
MFSTALITPTVISFFDDGQDVALFLDMTEEEENKGKEASKDLEVKINPTEQFSSLFLNRIQKKKNVSFQSKTYISEYPKNTTPPPEFLS